MCFVCFFEASHARNHRIWLMCKGFSPKISRCPTQNGNMMLIIGLNRTGQIPASLQYFQTNVFKWCWPEPRSFLETIRNKRVLFYCDVTPSYLNYLSVPSAFTRPSSPKLTITSKVVPSMAPKQRSAKRPAMCSRLHSFQASAGLRRRRCALQT